MYFFETLDLINVIQNVTLNLTATKEHSCCGFSFSSASITFFISSKTIIAAFLLANFLLWAWPSAVKNKLLKFRIRFRVGVEFIITDLGGPTCLLLHHCCHPVYQQLALLNNVSSVGDPLLLFSQNELEDFALMLIRTLCMVNSLITYKKLLSFEQKMGQEIVNHA